MGCIVFKSDLKGTNIGARLHPSPPAKERDANYIVTALTFLSAEWIYSRVYSYSSNPQLFLSHKTYIPIWQRELTTDDCNHYAFYNCSASCVFPRSNDVMFDPNYSMKIKHMGRYKNALYFVTWSFDDIIARIGEMIGYFVWWHGSCTPLTVAGEATCGYRVWNKCVY